MACSNALAFCVAHRDFYEEEILVRELSKVKEQLSQGLQYFSFKPSTSSNSASLKDQVQRFLSKLSSFLNLSEDRCLDLLVHYLAARNADGLCDENQIQSFVADGHINDLLNRIRVFYWQERMSLLALIRITVCDWHESWCTLSDILFAMTPYASREKLLDGMLEQYIETSSATESLLADGCYGFVRLIQPTTLTDFESQDEFDLIVSQRLKEQLEMLNILLTGVHALCDARASSAACFFSKLLEAFWSQGFGLQPGHVQSLVKHRYLIDRICFTQTLVLIRAANLDCLTLFANTPSREPAKQSNADEGTGVRSSSESSRGHFLYDAHLLNRLLASLSGLGDSPMHGPLLLFGATCATAFAPISDSHYADRPEAGDSLPVSWTNPEDRKGLSGPDGCAEVSETAHLIGGQYAQLAIESLEVFGYLSAQLTGGDRPVTNSFTLSDSVTHEELRFQPGTDINLSDFCAHVAVFDLLCLLAQHVVLWTLDGINTDTSSQSHRLAYLRLFARSIGVIAHYPHLTTRVQEVNVSDTLGIGQRIAGLIESLAEGFPCDLSLLHLCTALMAPVPNHEPPMESITEEPDSLVQLVSDLITALPYLTEPFTLELQGMVQPSTGSLYPQLGTGDQFVSNGEVVLTRARTVLGVDWRQRSGTVSDRQRYATPSSLYAGVSLSPGSRGKVEPDLGWVVWKQNYPVWNVVTFEVEKALILLDRMRSFVGNQSSPLRHTPLRAKSNKVSRDTPIESPGSAYESLSNQLRRVQILLDFLAACVEAEVHVSTCLYLMEDIWLLIERTLTLSGESTDLVRTQTTPQSLSSISGFLYSHMIPTALRIFASAFSTISSSGTVELFMQHTGLWNQVLLRETSQFFPRLTLCRAGGSSRSSFSLSASHLTGPLSVCLNSHPMPDSSVSYSTRHTLIAAYLEFLFGLLTATKWMCTLTRSSGLIDLALDSIEAWINQSVEVIRGGLLVAIHCVRVVGTGVQKRERWIPSSTPSVHHTRNRWLLILAERTFVLLTDLLTTHASTTETRQAFRMLNTSLTSQSGSALPARTPHVIAALQAIALHLLLDNSDALQGLLTLSSVPLHSLLAQFKALDQGLTVGVPSNGLGPFTLCSVNPGRAVATVVWLGLTLVHHVLGLERAMLEAHEASAPDRSTSCNSLLSSLIGYMDPSTREHYVAVLFTYLRYPYGVGLPRSAVTLLKWLTQHASVNIMDYLSPDSSATVRDCVLSRLSHSPSAFSFMNDPLTRVGLFDLVAETVLASPTDRTGKRSAQFLRFLTPSSLSSVKEKGTPNMKPDCLDCCLAVLEEVKARYANAMPDQLSILLLNSVSKLIAALFLQEANVYINLFKSREDFWQLLTDPVFVLLSAVEEAQNDFSTMEHEYCGHVASILGLELFCLLNSSGYGNLSDSLHTVLSRLTRENLYNAWFRLVSNTLSSVQSGKDEEPKDAATVNCPLFSSLYEATCRWKCLLMVHLDWLKQSKNADGSTSGLGSSKNNTMSCPNTAAIIDHVLCSLGQLKRPLNIPAASDLANQLAICLSIAVNQHLSRLPAKSNEDHLSESQLAQLIDFLMTIRPGLNEQARHLHADLLACANVTWRVLQSATGSTTGSDPKNAQTSTGQLQADLTDCAIGYVAQLASYPNLTPADESALRQALSLLLELWDASDQSAILCDRLVQAGVLNNLLVTLEQYSQCKTAASLCHDILILVMRVLLTDGHALSMTDGQLLPIDMEAEQDSSDGEKSTRFTLHFTTAQLIGSYGDSLVRAFQWPPTETLLQWIQEDEVAACQSSSTVPCSVKQNQGNWIKLILTQLRCLCLLHDRLDGLQQPFVARLLDRCCTQNASQMQTLFHSWCAPLYDRDRIQRQLTPLPRIACLMHDGSLSVSRLELARGVGEVYWRFLVAGQSLNASPLVSGSGIPTIGSNVLYRNDARIDKMEKPYLPTYGPNTTPQFSLTVWELTEWQLHCCAVLLQSFELRLGFKTTLTSAGTGNSITGTPVTISSTTNTSLGPSVTPNKTITGYTRMSTASPRRSQTPVGNTVRTDVGSPQPTITQLPTEPGLNEMCSGEHELASLLRHVILCLSILSTQIPLLGRMALFTIEELQVLRPSIQLVFSTPSLEDNSPRLTFGILITLAHSLSYLFLKVSRHIRSDSPATKSACELSALLAQGHEMTVAVMLSQATLILLHENASPAEKQLLARELVSEMKSFHLKGRSSRRRHSLGHRSSHSPSSQSSSTARALHRNASPHASVAHSTSTAAAAAADLHSIGTKLSGPDMSGFGFDQAIDRFADLLRLSI